MNDGTRSVGICLNGREMGSEMFLDQKETLLFCCLYILHKMWEGCGLQTVEEVTPWRDLTLVQQGYSGEGGGAQCSEHRDIFVRLYLPLFKTAKVWSVALVANRGELVLIIQTDGPLGELMLWDYLTSLGSTVLWVTWQEMRGVFFFLSTTHMCLLGTEYLQPYLCCSGMDFRCGLRLKS